jgi:hypothetical protein
MLERKEAIEAQLTADMKAAWPVSVVVLGEPAESERAPYGCILCGTVEEGDNSTPTLIDEVYPFALIGRFRKVAGSVPVDMKNQYVRALTSLLLAGANYATYGFLPAVEMVELDEMDEPDEPEWELAIRFVVHAYGARLGTSLD